VADFEPVMVKPNDSLDFASDARFFSDS